MKDTKKLFNLLTLAVAANAEGKVNDSQELFIHFCEAVKATNETEDFADHVSVAIAAVLEEAMADLTADETAEETSGDAADEDSDADAQSGDTPASESADLLDKPDELESMDLDEALDDSNTEERAGAIDADEDFTEEAALAAISQASHGTSVAAPVETAADVNLSALFTG